MSFFRKKSEKKAPFGKRISADTATENPYLNAQRTWNSHVGSLVASRTVWQMIGIISLLIVLSSVGGMIYIGSQSKFIPYVVEVDKLGEAVAAGPVARASKVDERIVRVAVSDFITNARLVTPDIALQRKAVLQVYSMLNGGTPASNKMTAFLNGNPDMNPFKRAATQTVNADIVSIIPQTANTWQVDWTETVRERKSGATVGQPYRMRALVTVTVRPELAGASEEQMRMNPLGIYVSDYAWSKQN
jgi:type IV secretion system protein VirB5